LLSFADFFQCTFIAGFQNNFQDHRRVTEQLLETQAAIESSLKSVTRRNFTIFYFLSKKTTKNCENHRRSFKKYCFDYRTLKIFISWQCPFRMRWLCVGASYHSAEIFQIVFLELVNEDCFLLSKATWNLRALFFAFVW
jgi:hypothetical protein